MPEFRGGGDDIDPIVMDDVIPLEPFGADTVKAREWRATVWLRYRAVTPLFRGCQARSTEPALAATVAADIAVTLSTLFR